MNDLFAIAAQNTIIASIFALFVFGLTRYWRNPTVAHVLWLLVLLKLVIPPLMHVDWSALRLPEVTRASGRIIADMPRIEEQKAESHPTFVDRPTAGTATETPAMSEKDHDFAARIWMFWNRARPLLLWFWLGGAALCALIAATRIVRFERLLRGTLPASERLQRLTLEIAGKIGVRRVPDVRYVECVKIPMLWCAGRRATIALPICLVCQPDNQRSALILAHEMAHLRRRDHWVRAVELIISIVYWWNPLVWLIRRQIHQAEDLCCDAWVRWAFPDCRRRYAEVVLQTAESLSSSQVGARLLPASLFLHSLSLKARIEMILESRFAPSVSKRSRFVIALLALLLLPSFGKSTRTEVLAASDEQASATPSGKHTPTPSEFPYAVKFEQGATAFFDGDKITILEVRGTSDTFTPGNIYWIKGTYSLASHERATLAAYTTAMDAENATGYSFKAQTTVVNQGNDTFTVFLPMSCRGWPHISFYPADGGSDFGGSYFGTGESVLKQWWGSKEKDRKLTSSPAGSSNIENANDRQTKQVLSRPGDVEDGKGQSAPLLSDKQMEQITQWQAKTWQIKLHLDMPGLEPGAVQYAVLDKDPVPGYIAQVKLLRKFHNQQFEQADTKPWKDMVRVAQMKVDWDYGFKDVTGENLYLLTKKGTELSSNGPVGQKWVVTRTVDIEGRPVCWCIPIEVKTGEKIDITFDKSNTFDLQTMYDKVMKEPSGLGDGEEPK